MKSWDSFEEKDIANLLSGISHNVNELKGKLNQEDYQSLAGDIILLKNKLIYGNRHSRYEDISYLYPKIENEKSDK
jgi:hypothetical protein